MGCLDRDLPIVFLKMRFMDETLGSESSGQTPSKRSFSLISHAKSDVFDSLYSRIFRMTRGVETRGLLPPVMFIRISDKKHHIISKNNRHES